MQLPLGRRRLLTAGALGLFTLGAGGCSPPTADRRRTGPGEDAGWSFTDDTRRTIRLERRPRRIVAYASAAAALWDYGIHAVGVYGHIRKKGGGTNVSILGEVNPDEVTAVGNISGHISVERLGRVRADLIVDVLQYGRQQLDANNLPLARRLLPILSIEVYGAEVDTAVGRYADLAAALGVDFDTPELRRAKATYTAARESVRRAAAAKPGLRVACASADQDGIRITKTGFAAVADFLSLGLDVIKPTGGGVYVEKLSWELVDRYPADLILLDVRASSLQAKDLDSNALWRNLPAVRTGRLGPWNPEPTLSYPGMTKVYESLLRSLDGARPGIA
ncbi:ABC transporter substrate-binding protein [Streptomyces sp. NPDC048057]|uniref:ABC transporter substrate-binding protein n=1 Tax=Streptomyces sp. NPDC048057 TaxID=3155628 RepID=UPI00340D1E94